MRKILLTGLGGLSLLLLLTTPKIVFSAEANGPIDQDRLDHFTEKYPEAPDSVGIPSLKIRGFGDFSFIASHKNNRSSGEYKSQFFMGSISLLFTSQINDRVHLLSELVAYQNLYVLERTQNHSYSDYSSLDFQRFALKYAVSDDVNITVGKYHTALGYWNHTYHHGAWLQPSIERPDIYLFEYEKGTLPEHSVGVEVSGFKIINPFDIRYHIGVSNGRGKKLWYVQGFRDENKSKALSVFLTLQPHRVEGLRFGGSFYLDTIPKTTFTEVNDLPQPNQIDERIAGGHLIYIGEQIEFLAEYFELFHSERNTGLDFNTEGGYLQANYKMDSMIAYYRFDYIDYPVGMPAYRFYHVDRKKHMVGLRWDLFSWNALKFELGRNKHKNKEAEYSVLINTSFTF